MKNNLVPRQAFTGKAYDGLNVITLDTVKATRNYETNEWATFLEWKKN